MPSQGDSPQRDLVSGKLSQQKRGRLGRPETRRQECSLLRSLSARRRGGRRGGGGRGGRGGGRARESRVLAPGLLGIAGDMNQKLFHLPLGPHVLLAVTSIHIQPSFPLHLPIVSPNSRALMEGYPWSPLPEPSPLGFLLPKLGEFSMCSSHVPLHTHGGIPECWWRHNCSFLPGDPKAKSAGMSCPALCYPISVAIELTLTLADCLKMQYLPSRLWVREAREVR